MRRCFIEICLWPAGNLISTISNLHCPIWTFIGSARVHASNEVLFPSRWSCWNYSIECAIRFVVSSFHHGRDVREMKKRCPVLRELFVLWITCNIFSASFKVMNADNILNRIRTHLPFKIFRANSSIFWTDLFIKHISIENTKSANFNMSSRTAVILQ